MRPNVPSGIRPAISTAVAWWLLAVTVGSIVLVPSLRSCLWPLTVSPEPEQFSRTGAGRQDLPAAQGEVVGWVVVERPEEAPRVGQELLRQQDRHTQERPLEADLQAGI